MPIMPYESFGKYPQIKQINANIYLQNITENVLEFLLLMKKDGESPTKIQKDISLKGKKLLAKYIINI